MENHKAIAAPVAVILGSAFARTPPGLTIAPLEIDTPWGRQVVYRAQEFERPAYLIFRHGLPHRLLPNQIPYRAQAWALRALGCRALLATSSVGVLKAKIPLYKPLLIGDILMPDNRLPDGSACTLFVKPSRMQGHLVLEEGLCSQALCKQVRILAAACNAPIVADTVFAYVGGPRTKTRAENRLWAKLGAEVNAMTLAPELVLANEAEIPCAALVVGHKYSLPDAPNPLDEAGIAESLTRSHAALEAIVTAFLKKARHVPFGNTIYRFSGQNHADSK